MEPDKPDTRTRGARPHWLSPRPAFTHANRALPAPAPDSTPPRPHSPPPRSAKPPPMRSISLSSLGLTSHSGSQPMSCIASARVLTSPLSRDCSRATSCGDTRRFEGWNCHASFKASSLGAASGHPVRSGLHMCGVQLHDNEPVQKEVCGKLADTRTCVNVRTRSKVHVQPGDQLSDHQITAAAVFSDLLPPACTPHLPLLHDLSSVALQQPHHLHMIITNSLLQSDCSRLCMKSGV